MRVSAQQTVCYAIEVRGEVPLFCTASDTSNGMVFRSGTKGGQRGYSSPSRKLSSPFVTIRRGILTDVYTFICCTNYEYLLLV